MKYTLVINHEQAITLGLNVNQALILSVISESHTWADPEIIDGEVYYWTARQKISEELKMLNLKSDTVYRNFKKLEELGLIEYIKSGKKDCIRLTKKGKSYTTKQLLENNTNTMSDEDPKNGTVTMSDENPNKLGSSSENDSDLAPTYNNTNIILILNNNYYKKISKKIVEKIKKNPNINLKALADWLGYKKYKSIAPITKTINFLSQYNYDTQWGIVDKSIRNGYKGIFPPSKNEMFPDSAIDASLRNNIFDVLESINN